MARDAMGRSDEAIREGREAVRIDPVSLFPNLNLGWSLYFAHRHDDSISQLNKVLELDPQFAWANMELGWNYAKKGMYREAVAECQRALNLMPDSQVILGSCGRILVRPGGGKMPSHIWPGWRHLPKGLRESLRRGGLV